MVTQQIKLYMDDPFLPDVRMVSGDIGREIMLTIYPNKEEEEELDLTTFTTRVIYIKPDKTFVIEDYLDGVMDIPEQAGAVVGRGYYQIKLSKNGEEIYSGQGDFYIDDNILNDSMVESIAEVNGYKFPDDFLTSADLADYVKQEDLDDYATKNYVDDAISQVDPKHTYSTDEQVVGTWIDGKPIYEKTFPNIITQSGNTTYQVPHNIANVDYVVDYWGGVKSAGGGMYKIPIVYPSANVFVHVNCTTTYIEYRNTWFTGQQFSYVTMQYTKTTD